MIVTTCWLKRCVLFVDTSALFAALVRDDAHHADAARVELEIRARREQLWTIHPVLTLSFERRRPLASAMGRMSMSSGYSSGAKLA